MERASKPQLQSAKIKDIEIGHNSDSETSDSLVLRKSHFKQVPALSVVIPAYNETMTIVEVTNGIQRVLEQMNIDNEIIIVDDGSIDTTRDRALGTGARIVANGTNQGKGTALRRGFLVARAPCILMADSDGAHTPRDIQAVIKEYFSRECHMVIGSRFLTHKDHLVTSPTNLVGNKIFNFILSMFSLSRITDSQSGLRIISRDLLFKLVLNSPGFEIETEITAKAVGLGATVEEIPIGCQPRFYGRSNLNTFRDGLKILKTMIFSYLAGLKLRNR